MVVALPNGNIVITDPGFNNTAGAVYLYNGATGVLISRITGSHFGDQVGSGGVYTLTNGSTSFVILSPDWANGPAARAGAVSWSDGIAGITGVVSITNSLVGSHANDQICLQVGSSIVPIPGRDAYVVSSPYWANGAAVKSGAMTLAPGSTPITGGITTTNSVLGIAAGGGISMTWAYDNANWQLAVGRPADNIVTLFRPSVVHHIFVSVVMRV